MDHLCLVKRSRIPDGQKVSVDQKGWSDPHGYSPNGREIPESVKHFNQSLGIRP
jgi:hypothetical protein